MAAKNFPEGLDRVAYAGVEKEVLMRESLERYDFRAYVDVVWSVVDEANLKIGTEEPFKLVKVDREAAKQSLSQLAAMIRWIAEALVPVMPETAEKIQARYASDIIETGMGLFPRRDGK